MGEASASRSRANRFRIFVAVGATAVLAGGAAIGASAADASPTLASQLAAKFPGYHIPATVSKTLYDHSSTSTPIKHLVVIFDENESFDHYFGTYPYAANTDGTPFVAKPGTPTVNGLYSEITSKGPIGPLLTDNPNEYDPQRLTSARGPDLGPEPRLRSRAAGRRQQQAGRVRPEHRVIDAVQRLRP